MLLRRSRSTDDAPVITASAGTRVLAAHARFLTILSLGLFVAAVYWTTFSDLISHYSQEDYSALPLVYGVVAFLVWHRETAISRLQMGANWVGLVALTFCVIGWYVARSIHVQAGEQVFAIGMIPAFVAAIVGAAVFREIAFPMLFLFGAVPWGEDLYPVLMQSTALISTFLLQICGIPVLRNDMFLSLPGGEFRIAEACAGLSYATAGTLLSLLFACMTWKSWKPRLLFLAAAIPIFVVGNGVRAFIVMVVASGTNMRYLAGHDHVTFGFFFFFVLLAALFWAALRISGKNRESSVESEATTETTTDSVRNYNWRTWPVAAIALLVFVSAAAVDTIRGNDKSAATLSLQLPAIAGCDAPAEWTANWKPVVNAPNGEVRGSYSCGKIAMNAFEVVYLDQQEGRELVSSGNVFEPKEWANGSRVEGEIAALNGSQLATNEITVDSKVENADRETFAVYWYLVNGAAARSAIGEKLLEAQATLALRKVDARVYLVAGSASKGEHEILRSKVREAARTIALREVSAR